MLTREIFPKLYNQAKIYLIKVNNRDTTHYKKVWNILKVNNKNTRTASMT